MDWYAAATRAGVPTASTTTAKGGQAVRTFKGSKGPDLAKLGLIVAAAFAIAMAVSIGLVAGRRRRNRVEAALVGPHVEHEPLIHTPADEEVIDRLTNEIFGD